MSEITPTIYDYFPNFYNHTFIQSIAQNPKWSISDKDKRPLDMFELENNKRCIGCEPELQGSMTTLEHSIQILPMPSNHAYYMDIETDGFAVLDIEPSCPAPLKQKFLELPYLYAEKSLSGKGLHLILPVPKNYNEFPIAKTKQKMQEKHRHYEILLQHWVTFTREMLPPSQNENPDDGKWEKLYAQMATIQKENDEAILQFKMKKQDLSNIPESDIILDLLINANHYNRTLQDFQNDHSKYEMGVIAHKYRRMLMLFKSSLLQKTNHTYTPAERVALLFEIAKVCIEPRPKHDELRNKMPWLMYLSKCVVERNTPKDDPTVSET